MKLYSAEEMTRADEGAQRLGILGGVLMERAGAEMARVGREFYASLGHGHKVLVVCGGGNNGGDGFVIAREFYRAGAEVAVLPTKDEYEGGAKTNLEILRNLDVRILGRSEIHESDYDFEEVDLIVDALLGTGFSGKVRGEAAEYIDFMNSYSAPILSVDVPSGVDASTGEVQGVAVCADVTVCAHAAKIGCAVSPGREHASSGKEHGGKVLVVDIGIPPEADVEPAARWTNASSLRGVIPRRAGAAHKYSAGSLVVVAGSAEATGAAVMVGKGAQRAGCGIIFVVTAESDAPLVDVQLTEALVSGAPEDGSGNMSANALESILEGAQRASAMVVGPAMGVEEDGRKLVEGILDGADVPVLLDADAISNLAESGLETLARRTAPTVITPHAGEFGRLLGEDVKKISARRLHFVQRAAREAGCCILLKGEDTLVAQGERVAVNSSGNSALATAGTGDVLSGVIGALLARGTDPYNAARAGAWAHGRAAELWLEDSRWPPESMAATDLLPYLPRAFAEVY
ncbi:MAG TPA: NAD(P)H-hydrate dehydratase, partial [Rubrobacter sp.]|nr:NAD(P)H-hydrate dehydratase [Rubrobacter sp.]